MKCCSYNKFFEVFANTTRLKIIQALHSSEKNVSDICKDTKEEQSKVSHNLKVLMDCSFVKCRQEGKNRIYKLNDQTINPLMKLVDKHVMRHCSVCKVKK